VLTGAPGEALALIFERTPGLSESPMPDGAVALHSASGPIALARADGAALVVEMPLGPALRETLEAAGLAGVLPRGRRASWRLPPDDPDEVVAVLRAAALAP
jgi:hypothetical protein